MSIDWNHPLAVAARANDALADDGDFTLPEIVREVGVLDAGGSYDDVYYVARQRALRALAVMKGEPIQYGRSPILSPQDDLLLTILTASYIDGLCIGWRAHGEMTNSEPPYTIGAPTVAASDDPEVI